MSLHRKENNLRRAQARFDRVSRRSKQIQIDFRREAVDDYHRGVFLMGRTAVDAVKGTHDHLKTKKQYKLEKAKLQLKKADNKLYKAKTQKPKMAATKADLKKAKAEYKARIVKNKA